MLLVMSHGGSNLCGVAILFKKGFDFTILSKFEDPLGSYLILKAEIKDKLNVLIIIYAPNNDKDITNFLNNPRTILLNENLEDEENIIIGGEINCLMVPALDGKKVVQCYRGNQSLKPFQPLKPTMQPFPWILILVKTTLKVRVTGK